MQIDEFQREVQISTLLPAIKVQSETSAPNRGVFRHRRLCLGEEGSRYCGVPTVGQKEDRHVCFCRILTSLPFVFEANATGTESSDPTPKSFTPLMYNDPPSGFPLTDTEVLLLGLKSGTSYNATVYPRAPTGLEGEPQLIVFSTRMLDFIKWLQLVSSTKFCPL